MTKMIGRLIQKIGKMDRKWGPHTVDCFASLRTKQLDRVLLLMVEPRMFSCGCLQNIVEKEVFFFFGSQKQSDWQSTVRNMAQSLLQVWFQLHGGHWCMMELTGNNLSLKQKSCHKKGTLFGRATACGTYSGAGNRNAGSEH